MRGLGGFFGWFDAFGSNHEAVAEEDGVATPRR
jgi:hypothetical protein